MMIYYILLAFDILFVTIANLLLKKGTVSLSNIDFSLKNILTVFLVIVKNPYILLGLSAYGISFTLWLFVLSKVKLYIAYPISVSITITLISLAAIFLYKEVISALQIVGVATIILGIILLLSAK